ncbi:hypothetical protein Aduo_013740 [Ancylostoma duodenale]
MTAESERVARILKGFDPTSHGLSEDFFLTKLTAMKGCGCKVPRAILLELLKSFDADTTVGHEGVGIGLDSCVVQERERERRAGRAGGAGRGGRGGGGRGGAGRGGAAGRRGGADGGAGRGGAGRGGAGRGGAGRGGEGRGGRAGRGGGGGGGGRQRRAGGRTIISMFIQGFKDAATAAGTKVRGGQTVRCPWLLLGGVATSVASDAEIIRVERAQPGDVLVLTKPIGGQVAVNAYEWLKKKNGRVEEYGLDEEKIIRAFQQVTEQMTRLNRNAAKMLHKYNAHASTDVTGFGILGHADNLSRAQTSKVRFVIDVLPIIEYMDEIARKMPNGNGFNLFGGTSAETSGGLLVAVSPKCAEGFVRDMEAMDGHPAWIVGRVEKLEEGVNHAIIQEHFNVISVPSRIHK